MLTANEISQLNKIARASTNETYASNLGFNNLADCRAMVARAYSGYQPNIMPRAYVLAVADGTLDTLLELDLLVQEEIDQLETQLLDPKADNRAVIEHITRLASVLYQHGLTRTHRVRGLAGRRHKYQA